MSENERENLRDARERLQTALDALAGPVHTIHPNAISRAKMDIVEALIHLRRALGSE